MILCNLSAEPSGHRQILAAISDLMQHVVKALTCGQPREIAAAASLMDNLTTDDKAAWILAGVDGAQDTAPNTGVALAGGSCAPSGGTPDPPCDGRGIIRERGSGVLLGLIRVLGLFCHRRPTQSQHVGLEESTVFIAASAVRKIAMSGEGPARQVGVDVYMGMILCMECTQGIRGITCYIISIYLRLPPFLRTSCT